MSRRDWKVALFLRPLWLSCYRQRKIPEAEWLLSSLMPGCQPWLKQTRKGGPAIYLKDLARRQENLSGCSDESQKGSLALWDWAGLSFPDSWENTDLSPQKDRGSCHGSLDQPLMFLFLVSLPEFTTIYMCKGGSQVRDTKFIFYSLVNQMEDISSLAAPVWN